MPAKKKMPTSRGGRPIAPAGSVPQMGPKSRYKVKKVRIKGTRGRGY